MIQFEQIQWENAMDVKTPLKRQTAATNDVRSARIVKRGAVLRVLVISVSLAVVLMFLGYVLIR
jgi:hypothetical protein